jgi:hypothetical protein
MSACFRQRVIAFFLERKLPNERLAKNMLDWTHSGFSVDASIHIDAGSAKTREALAQYIVRTPSSIARRTPTTSEPTRRSSPPSSFLGQCG